MSSLFNFPITTSNSFLKIIKYFTVVALLFFSVGAFSIVSSCYFGVPIIPDDLYFFISGINLLAYVFLASFLFGNINFSERVIYFGLAFYLTSLVLFINHWTGGELMIEISFIYISICFVLSTIQKFRGKKIELPNLNLKMILYVLVMIIIVMLLGDKILQL